MEEYYLKLLINLDQELYNGTNILINYIQEYILYKIVILLLIFVKKNLILKL